MSKYTDALDDLLDRPISYNPAFKRITKRTSAAVWLSQMWYWSKRATLHDGWFWKSAKECAAETGLTDNEQLTAREICKALGVIEEKLNGVPATLHFRIVKEKIYELLGFQFPTEQETEIPTEQETSFPESGKQDSHSMGNFNKESETTARTTTRAITKKIISSANKKVDAVLAQERAAQGKLARGETYPHREKIPEPMLELIDEYVRLTGQRPAKGDLMDWIATGSEWLERGIQAADLREAYARAKPGNGRGFSVSRPGSLTRVAGECAGERRKRAEAGIDRAEVERTRRLLAEREVQAVPPPADVFAQIAALTKKMEVK